MFDTTKRYGTVSILLHWLTAIAILGLFLLGFYMVTLDYYHPLYIRLPYLHKSIGVLVVLLPLCRFVWKRFNPSPLPIGSHTPIEITISRYTHTGLFALTGIVIFSGYLISTANNSGINVFNWFILPASVTTLPQQEDLAGLVHKYVAYAMLGTILLHAGAALKHHFVDKDVTLLRMLGVQADNRD